MFASLVSELRSKKIEDHFFGLKEMITTRRWIKKTVYYLFNKDALLNDGTGLLSMPPGMASCKNTSSVTVEGCRFALLQYDSA